MSSLFSSSLAPLHRPSSLSTLLANNVLRGHRNDPARQALAKLTRQLTSTFETSLKQNLESMLGGNASATEDGAGGSLPDFSALAGSLIGDVVQFGLSSLLSGTHTTTVTAETSRSQDAAQQFRESRSQVQARLARDIARGQRNL